MVFNYSVTLALRGLTFIHKNNSQSFSLSDPSSLLLSCDRMAAPCSPPCSLSAQDLEDFSRRGFVRVRGAFSAQTAARGRAEVWRLLGSRGVTTDPASWAHVKVNPLDQSAVCCVPRESVVMTVSCLVLCAPGWAGQDLQQAGR